MLYAHRLFAALSAFLLLYIAVTGAGIQLADMRALVTHAPETDPDMLMMRQHIYGTPNYAVVSAPDYTAPPLPANLNLAGAVQRAAALGRAASPSEPLRLVEVRTAEGKLAGHVQMGAQHLIFALSTGRTLPRSDLPPEQPGRDFQSIRSNLKFLHRFNYLGQWATGFNALAGIVFALLILTGLWHYAGLYQKRAKLDRKNPIWRAGGLWRDFHRWTAISCGVLVFWIAATGFVLSLDNFGAFTGGLFRHPGQGPHGPNGFDGDLSSPLTDVQLPKMTEATLAAFARNQPGVGVKVLRLRYYSDYPQGVIVAADPLSSQRVFNTDTGAPMTMTEPGYPKTGFPLGWEWHQRMKMLHRGDYFGMPGRWLDTIGALAMVYLTVSGMVMYLQLLVRRWSIGKKQLIWK